MPKENSMNKYALVIGVSDHEGANGAGDAQLVTGVLRSASYDIHRLIGRKATREAIYQEFDWLRGIQNEDSKVVIFWSSHGTYGSIAGYQCLFPVLYLAEEFSDFISKHQAMMFCGCRCGSLIVELNPSPPPLYVPTELCTDNRLIVTAAGYGGLPEPYKQYTKWGWFFVHEGLAKGMSIQKSHQYAKDNLHGRGGLISDNYGSEFFL